MVKKTFNEEELSELKDKKRTKSKKIASKALPKALKAEQQSIKKDKVPVSKKPAKKAVKVKRSIRESRIANDVEYISGTDVWEEIRRNKDCYPMHWTDTAVVFTKKVEISVSKINDNSVFQPHEKTEKMVYCAVIVFEFNHIMEEYHSRRFAMQDISQRYKPYVERGAKVYVIRDISEIEGVIKGIE